MVAEHTGRPWRMLFTDGGEFSMPEDLRAVAVRAGVEIVALAGHDPGEIAAAMNAGVRSTV